jgi:SAM-dependent methyltransferase
MDQIRADFDRIAALPGNDWNHNIHYHDFLLSHLPEPCQSALDMGCGTGAFARRLAERSAQVVAIDLSPQMIAAAGEQSAAFANIDYQVADALTWNYPTGAFDCAASIATLHHLPLETILIKMRDSLRPGGVLLVLDLYRPESTLSIKRLASLVALPVSVILRLIKTGRLREPAAKRAAYAAHGQHDRYPTLSEVRRVCNAIIPGASVRCHLLWRYSIIWRRPD